MYDATELSGTFIQSYQTTRRYVFVKSSCRYFVVRVIFDEINDKTSATKLKYNLSSSPEFEWRTLMIMHRLFELRQRLSVLSGAF
jgi:hypothetical protein